MEDCNSFTIKFEFTDLEKVYKDDRASGIEDRKRFFKDLLIEIWDLNRLISTFEGVFPLYKITIESMMIMDFLNLKCVYPNES